MALHVTQGAWICTTVLVVLLMTPVSKGADPVFTAPVALQTTVDEGDASGLSLTVTATDSDPDLASLDIDPTASATISSTFQLTPVSSSTSSISATLELQVALDYETDQQFLVPIVAEDSAGGSVTSTVTINVFDLIDEPPAFSAASFTATIDETDATGTVVMDISTDVTDADAGDTVVYHITGTNANSFRMDANTGILYTAANFDYDTGDTSYSSLVLHATDSAGNANSAALTVNVNDINDEVPVCNPSVVIVNNIPENSGASTLVATLTCSDADTTTAYSTLTYSVTNGDDSGTEKFTMNSNLLETTSTALDSESRERYDLTIDVVDNSGGSPQNTAQITVIVQVVAENDNTPSWTTAPADDTISEAAAVGTMLMTVQASDADVGTDGTITYALESATGDDSSDGSSLFHVDPSGGQVMTAGPLDAEVGASGVQSYTLTISATDAGTSARSITGTMVVTITDVNEFQPEFGQTLHAATVAEGASVGTSVVELSAVTDADRDAPSLTYSFSTANAFFAFNSGTANQIDTSVVIDLDTGSSDPDSYTLVVLVSDGSGMTGTTTVEVTVTPTNDATPAFDNVNPSTITVAEDSSVGVSVATVTFTDDDYGAFGEITYSKGTGDPSNYFQVNANTGEILLQQPLDFDTLASASFSIQIIGTDGGSDSSSTVVTITVTDVSDEAPECNPSAYTVVVAEDENVGFTVETVVCSDADAVDSPTFSITGGDPASDFAISAAGVITLANQLDYDSARQSYQLEVTYSDGTNDVIVPVGVSVDPVNEFDPTFSSATYAVTKLESIAVGTSIFTMTADDDDYAPHNVISYAFDGTSVGEEYFSIDPSTGEITLVQPLDYETRTDHTLVVTATDGAGQTDQATLTVTVDDVNDNTPSCSPTSAAVEQAEGDYSSSPVILVTITCTDADTDTVSYSLAQTPNDGAFSLSTSNIRVSGTLDYEGTQFYELVLTASDGTNSVDVAVTVSVGAVNEGGPSFSGPYSDTISEAASLGDVVGTYAASDPDLATHAHGNLIYSIISGSAGAFQIDPASGAVSVASTLDFETTDTYTIELQVDEEAGTNSATAALTITVLDVDDEAPTCTDTAFSVSVDEDVYGGSTYTIPTVSLGCTDDDTTSLTYLIDSGDTSVFSITSAGALEVISALDYDSGTARVYALEISVSDGTRSVLISGSVNVAGINEDDPAFTASTYSVSVPESTSVGATVATVTAIDSDSTDTSDGQVTYAFSGTPPSGFIISDTTGEILLASALDYETSDLHTILVEATDGGSTTVTATVSITVTDVNDNNPVFQHNSYAATIAENDAAGTSVVTVTALDDDDPAVNDNGLIAYSINSGDSSGVFAIDTSSGEITVSGGQTVDYEVATSYSLIVLAKDDNGGAGANTASVLVTVAITPDNEGTPTFTQSTYTVNDKDEDLAVGELVTTVAATDSDASSQKHGVFVYSMSSHANFYLDAATGEIRVKSALDFETTPTYSLTVYATDSEGDAEAVTGSCTVDINVQDINDVTPQCTLASNVHTYAEDVTIGSTDIIDISSGCSDSEASPNGDLTYAITSVNGVTGTGDFALGSTSGVLTFAVQPDFESDTEYALIVTITDGGSPALSTTVDVVVTITDVNEGTPDFTGQQNAVSVSESSSVGTSILTITATDADTSDTLTYTLSSSEFVIDSATGEIFTTVLLDAETVTSYTLNIVGTDNNPVNSLRSATHVLTVTVTDVNDVTPYFDPASYVASVSEDASVGDTLTTVTANDEDSGSDGTITYSLVSSDFLIDSSTGVITVQSALDYETTTHYDLEVVATDGGGSDGTATVNVAIDPYNEAAPTFSPAAPTISVSEDESVGTSIGAVTATDADTGTDGDFAYVITAGNDGTFSVDPSNGDVHLIAALDFEASQSYTLTVKAIDTGVNPSALTGEATVLITVTDVNDVTPVFSPSAYATTVDEDDTAGSAVITVSCTDGDATGSFNAITYTITAGNGDAQFSIGSTSGAITLSNTVALDYEGGTTSYDLTVTGTDAASNSDTATVHIQVIGVNEHDPAYTGAPYSPTVDEDAAVDDLVETLVATDADDGDDGSVTYTLVSGNDDGKFALDLYSGELRLVESLDYETTTSYSLVVHAIDSGSPPRTAITTVTVAVNDINDNTPSCTLTLIATSLAENTAASTSVVSGTSMGCSDADASPNGDIAYAIDAGTNTNSAFTIDTSTGDITVNSQAALDIETTPVFHLSVYAVDQAAVALDRLTATITVTVTLTDVNESPPAFTPGNSYAANVGEEESPGYSAITVTATDDDVGSNGDVTYSITAGNGDSKFRIDSLTGEVSLQDTLDREDTDSYSLTITATDGGGSSATATLDITVVDSNDDTPACSGSPYAMSIAEDASVGDVVDTVTGCSDADEAGANTLLVYAITSGDASSHFSIDTATGSISVNDALDYETTKAYYLTIEVADSGSPAQTGTAYVTISVEPVNNFDPVITVPAGGLVATINEDDVIGSSVITIAGTDGDDSDDAHGQLRWSISGGNSQNHFIIDSSSGVVSVSGILNREATDSYTLTIRATDSTSGSGDERTDEDPLTITIDDSNDNYPVFTPGSYSPSVLESAAVGATVVQVSTTDDDIGANAVHAYAISSGNDASKFTMVGDEILLADTLDYETAQQYVLYVEASDPDFSATAIVVINVESVNEYNPGLDTTTTSVDISEDIAIGATLHTAAATDADAGDYGSVVYTITSGNPNNSTFLIDRTTGDITVGSYLDFDSAPQSYSLEITATDNNGLDGSLSDAYTFTVNLEDVNDNPPVFTMNTYNQDIDEDHGGEMSVITVTANDADSNENAEVTYSIVSGDGINEFSINSTTGQIDTVVTPDLDYETKTRYTLHVRATDSGLSTQMSSACLVIITLNDANDNDPEFDVSQLSVSVAENQAAGVSTAQFSAMDADSGTNADLIFTIDPSTDPDGMFALSNINSNTVQIDTANPLDRENTDSYTIRIRATDSGAVPRTGTATLTVYVGDENDETPLFTASSFSGSTYEDTEEGYSVLQVAATDGDEAGTENAEIRYSITSGNTGSAFEMDDVTGILRIANTLDRETIPQYILEVEAIDQGAGALTGTVSATVTILDVNDNAPVFASSFYLDVSENVPNGTLVGTVSASDADTGSNAIIYYTLVATSVGTQDHFRIEADSGDVYTNSDDLDRESLESYLLVARASNEGSPTLYTDTDVNITLNDVNDIVPLLSQNSYTNTIVENSPAGTTVLSVSAQDTDLDRNMVITYYIEGGLSDIYFDMNNESGIMTLRSSPDRELFSSFSLTIYATDNGEPALEDSAPTTIYISDVNDNRPVFQQNFYSTEIGFEDFLDGRTILTVSATDADSGDNALIHYTVVNSTSGFAILDSDIGDITRSAAVFDPSAIYTFVVKASDTGSSPLTDYVSVRIDTFPASVVLVELQMNISYEDFLASQTEFENYMEAYLNTYPNLHFVVYDVIGSSSRRRRLLQTTESPVDPSFISVYVYAMQYSSVNATSDKNFMTDDELLQLLQGTGTDPADFLTGATFASYGISTVQDYLAEPNDTPWWQTSEGVIVIISCTLVTLIIMIIIILTIVWVYWRRKKGKKTPVWIFLRNITVVRPHRSSMNELVPKKNIPLPVIVLPEVEVTETRSRQSDNVYKDKSLWGKVREKKFQRPRSVSPAPSSALPQQIQNREFDGKAYDPSTGRMYEYNTRTNERRWLTSAEGNRTPPPEYDDDY